MAYSEFAGMLLRDDELLRKLQPTEPSNPVGLVRLREISDEDLRGGKPVADPALWPLVRCGLFYLVDALDAAHRIAQDAGGDVAAYWHGMIHRREGDFDNARHWFRSAGTLPFFDEIQQGASAVSSLFAAQYGWDPYLFTGQCEQARFGNTSLIAGLVKVQRIEFERAFDYTWRKSVA